MLEEEYGILYPGQKPNHSEQFFSLFCEDPLGYHANIVRGIGTEQEADEHNARSRRALDEEFEATKAQELIISGEDLSRLNANGVGGFYEWISNRSDAVEIVAFVRHPLPATASLVQEAVKHGSTLDVLRSDPNYPMFRDRLEPWLEVFGFQNISLFDYSETRDHPNGILGFFCKQIGIPGEVYENAVLERHNASMSQEATELLSALNAVRPLFTDGKLGPRRFANDLWGFTEIPGSPFALSAEVCERVEALAEPHVLWLAREFNLHFRTVEEARTQGNFGFSEPALQYLAILISDRENGTQHDTLLDRARLNAAKGNHLDGQRLTREALRILPDSQVAEEVLKTIHAQEPAASLQTRGSGDEVAAGSDSPTRRGESKADSHSGRNAKSAANSEISELEPAISQATRRESRHAPEESGAPHSRRTARSLTRRIQRWVYGR